MIIQKSKRISSGNKEKPSGDLQAFKGHSQEKV
jgi:hypothetical protein